MARAPRRFPDSYAHCVICNGWYDSADPTQMQVDYRGQPFCYKHTYRMGYRKGAPMPKTKGEGRTQMGLGL